MDTILQVMGLFATVAAALGLIVGLICAALVVLDTVEDVRDLRLEKADRRAFTRLEGAVFRITARLDALEANAKPGVKS